MAFLTIETTDDDDYTATEGVELFYEGIGAGYSLLTVVGERDRVMAFFQYNADMGEDVTWVPSQILEDSEMDEHNSAATARAAL